MADYSKIKNERLRQLVMLSESIHSQEEAEIQMMIDRVAELPPEGQEAMIAALEEEQKQIRAAKLAKGITPEMEMKEMKELEKNSLKLANIKHDFDAAVLGIKKEKEQKESGAAAENILKNI